MDRFIYQAIIIGKNFLMKAYYTLILFLIAARIFGEVSKFIDYELVLQTILTGFIITEIIGIIFYFVLDFLIRVTESQLGLEGSLGGTEIWQIVRSWKFFKEDILKDGLIMNGFAVTVCAVLMNWVVM